MPVPSAITDLSTTAASNSPSGSDNVFPDLDNYIRALSAFIAQNYANKANTASPAFTGTVVAGTGSSQVFGFGGQTPNVQSNGTTGTRLGLSRWTADGNGAIQHLAKSRGAAVGTRGIVSNGDTLGLISFEGDDGVGMISAAYVAASVDGTPGVNDMPGRLVFFTTADGAASPTERVRIDSAGNVGIGTTSPDFALDVVGTIFADTGIRTGTVTGAAVAGTDEGMSATSSTVTMSRDGNPVLQIRRTSSDGSIQQFYRGTSLVGTVSVTTTATAYNTSSDYRLKQNPQPLTGSGSFIDALQPKTWQWAVDGSAGVGFIAHEVAAVSPSSVSGVKDAVDGDGEPVMQAMQYGSPEIVANMVAELQSLRARVAALEAA
jgi:hypothetical protein